MTDFILVLLNLPWGVKSGSNANCTQHLSYQLLTPKWKGLSKWYQFLARSHHTGPALGMGTGSTELCSLLRPVYQQDIHTWDSFSLALASA